MNLPDALAKKRDELAEKYISMSAPAMTRFNMSNDFKNGFDACFETLCSMSMEFDREAVKTWLAEEWDKSSDGSYPGRIAIANWQFDQLKTELAAREREVEHYLKLWQDNSAQLNRALAAAQAEIAEKDKVIQEMLGLAECECPAWDRARAELKARLK